MFGHVDAFQEAPESRPPLWTRFRVAADATGKKNGLVWAISCSPATKNSSTQPQQDVNSSPRVWSIVFKHLWCLGVLL
ncbi:hypothetical protein Taro_029997 [Colocasia esculenta]|uniref:Uncharacterized protein n=1 Tax=Colocasia esculenta TaxID=4460 RepID=A0A843VWL2_COLES|nr:hypothetical protein [Colocasia esculenta]